MIGLLLGAFLICSASACPRETIPPCTCQKENDGQLNMVDCINANDEETLRNSLERVSGFRVHFMYLIYSSLVYLPSDLFEGMIVEDLSIVNSTLMSLSDTDVAFKGLEKNLRGLRIQECFIYSGIDWKQLRNLYNLESLSTVNVGLNAIEEDLAQLANANITVLKMIEDQISYIHEGVLSNFKNLQFLSLARNLIAEITRNMLPNPAPKLKQLDLSHNQLETLPVDIFVDMPALVTLYLEGNQLVVLDQATMKPVWFQIHKIVVLKNPLRCDCRMKWMLSHEFPQATWGQCADPPSLKGKELTHLVAHDLWC